MCSGLVERWQRRNALACPHDPMDQRCTILIVVLYRKRVACHAAIRPVAPPNLLTARQGGLPGRMFAARQSGIFLQLVSTVERWRIRGGRQARADAESIDRCIG